MKIFVADDNVPLDVPLVPGVAAVAVMMIILLLLAHISSKETKNKNNKPWNNNLCSSSTCERIAATLL